MGGEIQGEETARDWDWRLRGRCLKGQPGQGRGFEDRLLGGTWGGIYSGLAVPSPPVDTPRSGSSRRARGARRP